MAEVVAALPEWTEDTVHSWMDEGWTAQQIIEHHTQPVAPEPPPGFGSEYESTKPEIQAKVESSDEIEFKPILEVADPIPNQASLKRLKKAELVELAELQGLDSSGTKADIISRLLG